MNKQYVLLFGVHYDLDKHGFMIHTPNRIIHGTRIESLEPLYNSDGERSYMFKCINSETKEILEIPCNTDIIEDTEENSFRYQEINNLKKEISDLKKIVKSKEDKFPLYKPWNEWPDNLIKE